MVPRNNATDCGWIAAKGCEAAETAVRRLISNIPTEAWVIQAMRHESFVMPPLGGDPDLAARIKTFETAFGMQMEIFEVFDLKGETDHTLRLYGLERGQVSGFGWQCLLARRLVERGVRVIELIDVGSSSIRLHCGIGYWNGA